MNETLANGGGFLSENNNILVNDMNNNEIKYCVAALIDLQGISSHLEVGRDLRTNIGGEVIERLNNLEKAIEIIETETARYSKFYNNEIHYLRFNDSIILTLDLYHTLLPETGESIDSGGDWLKKWKASKEKNEIKEEATVTDYLDFAFQKEIDPISKFVGLTSRIHIFINEKENANYFPGAKTVISTGFRQPFHKKNKDDYFSANFAFSNAFKAESLLKESNLYIENNVLELVSRNKFGRNICKFSQLHRQAFQFDPFSDKIRGGIYRNYITKSSIELTLFRRNYLFRECNPAPLIYLQMLKELLPFLNNDFIEKRRDWFGLIIKDINNGIELSEKGEQECESFLLEWILGLSFPLEVTYLYIKEGDPKKVPQDIKID